MSGGVLCGKCMALSDSGKPHPKCEREDCPGKEGEKFFAHIFAPNACDHDFQGWRDNTDDQGRVMCGEKVCTKCGMGAIAHSLATGI